MDRDDKTNKTTNVVNVEVNHVTNGISTLDVEHSEYSNKTKNGVITTNEDTISAGLKRNPITQNWHLGYGNVRTDDNEKTKQTKKNTVDLNSTTEGGETNYDFDVSTQKYLDMKNGAVNGKIQNYHLGLIRQDGQGITGGDFFIENISDDTGIDGWKYYESHKFGGGYKNNDSKFRANVFYENSTNINNNDFKNPVSYRQDSSYKASYENDKETNEKTISVSGEHNHSSEDDKTVESASNSFGATHTTGGDGQSFNVNYHQSSEYINKKDTPETGEKEGEGKGKNIDVDVTAKNTAEGFGSSGDISLEQFDIKRLSDIVSTDGKERRTLDRKKLEGGKVYWSVNPGDKSTARLGWMRGKTDTYKFESKDFTAAFNNTHKITEELVVDGEYAGLGLSFTKELTAEINKLKASGKLTAGADLLTNGKKLKINFNFEHDGKSNTDKFGNKGDNNRKYSFSIDEDGQISLSYQYTTESEKAKLIRELNAFKKEGNNYGFYIKLSGTF